MHPPKVVSADVPGQGVMYYLVDDTFDFVPEVKDFLDWKAATRRSPATIKAYCHRLWWYYHFLFQRQLQAREVVPTHLIDFVIWLCNPHRMAGNVAAIHTPRPFQESYVNLILHTVSALYGFLLRRGEVSKNPVTYVEVPKSAWLIEHDLLTHTRSGAAARTAQRMELKLKEPQRLPKTISDCDFTTFVTSIHAGRHPDDDPCGFRDRLICTFLKDSGVRIGELLGIHVNDLAIGAGGVHIRFRPDNENGSRAKGGYGSDRFVQLPPPLLAALDIYLTEVWVEASPTTKHLWIVLKRDAKTRGGCPTYGTALDAAAVSSMFRHYSHTSKVKLHPHMLRHTHATDLVRSYLAHNEPVDWKFIQERLGHQSVVTTMETYTHLTDPDRAQAYERYWAKKEATRD